jgi:hypothetical protein
LQPFLGYRLSERPDYGGSTAALIDRDIREVRTARRSGVEKLLAGNRDKLD